MSESGDSTGNSSGTASSGGGSIASNNSDSKALEELRENGTNEEIGDLLNQNRNLQDTIFATLFVLTKNKAAASWQITLLKIVLLFLQIFGVIFNTSMGWDVDREFWGFKSWSWILYRITVVNKGYGLYITIFYVLASATLLCMLVTAWVAVVLRKDDSSGAWMRRLLGHASPRTHVLWPGGFPGVHLCDCMPVHRRQ